MIAQIYSFTAAPNPSPAPGTAVSLTWSAVGAAIMLEPDPGVLLPMNGSIEVYPTQNTTYILTAYDDQGNPGASAEITVTIAPPPPRITGFTASRATITQGDSVTLTWSTSGATQVTLDPGIGALPLSGSINLAPAQTTNYVLTAKNAAGQTVTANNTVNVVGAPQFVSVAVDPPSSTIFPPQHATISWQTANAASLTIAPDPGGGPFPVNGSVQVSPAATTTYTLTITNAAGAQATYQITIYVIAPPNAKIDSFTASPNPSPAAGANVVLQWSTENADHAWLSPGVIGEVPVYEGPNWGVGQGPGWTVNPQETTTYTLRIQNDTTATTDSKEITVTVPPALPIITFYQAQPINYIRPGDVANLSWVTQNATQVTITPDPGVGALPTSGAVNVSPAVTTDYTLTARNANGDTVSSTVTVRVIPLPKIDGFSANPLTVHPGEQSLLAWQTENATSVAITPGVGGVAASGNVNVSPATTTTYTITASNTNGDVATATVTVTVVPFAQPKIDTFAATPNPSPAPGTAVTLAWQTEDAVSVTIAPDPGVGTLAVNGNVNVSPATTTDYILTAKNAAGDAVTATVTVTVTPLPPQIDSFTATPNPANGTSAEITLAWQTEHATQATITPDPSGRSDTVTVLPATGTISVIAVGTTTYTLVAKNANGVAVNAAVTVILVPPQSKIDFFTVTPAYITQGAQVTLAWQTENTDSITITPDLGLGSLSPVRGTVLLSPLVTTQYTLVAKNADGTSDTARVSVTVLPPAQPNLTLPKGTPKYASGGVPHPPADPLAQAMSRIGGVAPIQLLDVVANDGTSYHWASRRFESLNLLPNPGFEVAADDDQDNTGSAMWVAEANVPYFGLYRDTPEIWAPGVYSGSAGQRIIGPTGGQSIMPWQVWYCAARPRNLVQVTPGHTYDWGAMARTDQNIAPPAGVSVSLRAWLRVWYTDGTYEDAPAFLISNGNSGGWVLCSGTTTIRTDKTPTGAYFYFGNYIVNNGTAAASWATGLTIIDCSIDNVFLFKRVAALQGKAPAWNTALGPLGVANWDQTYLPWLLQAGPFHMSRSMQADIGNFVVQNISGSTIARDLSTIITRAEFEHALFIYREWNLEAQTVEFEMHGRLSVVDVNETTAEFAAEQLFNPSNYQLSDVFSETCRWRQYSAQCGATPDQPACNRTYPTCVVQPRFGGVLNTYYAGQLSPSAQLIPGEANVSQRNVVRRREV